jgi:hypothetical protein
MSQVLSGLILIELQKSNPNPVFLPDQKKLADAIAAAVQQYLSTTIVQVGPTGTGTIIAL